MISARNIFTQIIKSLALKAAAVLGPINPKRLCQFLQKHLFKLLENSIREERLRRF